jgi:hypothetical protein
VRTHAILQRLYGFPSRTLRHGSLTRWAWLQLVDLAQRHTSGLTIGSLIFGILVVFHVYYFNLLLDLESNVDTARAQIDVAKEKRNHVQRSLTQLLRFHAAYEKGVIKDVTTLRTASGPKPLPSEGLHIDAVGEQYPQLLLNTTIVKFEDSIVASEGDIAKRIADYNDAVNIYTNVLHQFPGNVFGRFLGYQDRQYFSPEDPSVLPYHELAP